MSKRTIIGYDFLGHPINLKDLIAVPTIYFKEVKMIKARILKRLGKDECVLEYRDRPKEFFKLETKKLEENCFKVL